MKLNLHTIAHELGSAIVGSSIHSDARCPKLDYPALLEKGDFRYYDNILYVGTKTDIFADSERMKRHLKSNPHLSLSILCVGTPPRDLLESDNCDIAWTNDSVALSGIFNSALKAFYRFASWEREINEIVSRDENVLKELAHASTRIFRNDICIVDGFSRVLAYRVFRRRRFTESQVKSIQEDSYLPQNMVLAGVEDEDQGWSFSSEQPALCPMTAFECTAARITVHAPEGPLLISVHPNFQDVGEKDFAPLIALADAVSGLQKACNAVEEERTLAFVRTALQALIEGNSVPDAEFSRCAVALGWNCLDDSFLCVCLMLARTTSFFKADRLARPLASLCDALQKAVPCVSFVKHEHIIAVIDLDAEGTTRSATLSKIEAFSQRFNLVAGASEAYTGLRSFVGCYHQAIMALKVSANNGTEHVAKFENHALEIGLECIASQIPPAQFALKSLVKLRNEEPALYEALKAYFAANGSASKAGAILSLQRNSFSYRMRKAEQTCQINLDDPLERLMTHLSIELLERFGR